MYIMIKVNRELASKYDEKMALKTVLNYSPNFNPKKRPHKANQIYYLSLYGDEKANLTPMK